ncbi:hypothetical protein MJI12_14355, partial [Salmonella enterica subsp. enterica serovar Kentucky]|nr:hypothetical protein [Salmonella enterica subsp. enterica serovar Kentucky]
PPRVQTISLHIFYPSSGSIIVFIETVTLRRLVLLIFYHLISPFAIIARVTNTSDRVARRIYRFPARLFSAKKPINGTRAVKHADSRGCSGREKCMYIYGIVIDPSSRFSGGLAIF